jgi:N utilization substance protein A
LASKLCGWDIDIMTREELEDALEKAVMGFSALAGVTPDLADRLVGEGFLTYGELSIIEPEDLMEMGGLTQENADAIVAQAEEKDKEAEQAVAAERRRQRELKAAAAAEAAEAAEQAARAAEQAAQAPPAEAENGQSTDASAIVPVPEEVIGSEVLHEQPEVLHEEPDVLHEEPEIPPAEDIGGHVPMGDSSPGPQET